MIVDSNKLVALQAEIYKALRDRAEQFGFVGQHADDKLLEAATAIALDPRTLDTIVTVRVPDA